MTSSRDTSSLNSILTTTNTKNFQVFKIKKFEDNFVVRVHILFCRIFDYAQDLKISFYT